MADNYQDLCICKMCPSYVDCHEPIAYCVPGAVHSRCITVRSGCVCPGCPVYDELALTSDYYCLSPEGGNKPSKEAGPCL